VTDTTAPAAPNPHGDAPATTQPGPPPPLREVAEDVRRRTAAEEARTIVAGSNVATLASLSTDGHPWGSFVTYGTLADGSPVLCLSTMAEHGRNLPRDPRASLVVATRAGDNDPLDSGRVTLAGTAEAATGLELDDARDAYKAAVQGAEAFMDFGDFTTYVLRVARVRWVGGFGRMDSTDAASYAAAQPDPVAVSAPYAVAHLNEDHADSLLEMAQALAGYTDATAARCTAADRYGLDLVVSTPRGRAPTRVGFAEPIIAPNGLRSATVELARRAKAVLAG
jgi:putative heme iron utilization protein